MSDKSGLNWVTCGGELINLSEYRSFFWLGETDDRLSAIICVQRDAPGSEGEDDDFSSYDAITFPDDDNAREAFKKLTQDIALLQNR